MYLAVLRCVESSPPDLDNLTFVNKIKSWPAVTSARGHLCGGCRLLVWGCWSFVGSYRSLVWIWVTCVGLGSRVGFVGLVCGVFRLRVGLLVTSVELRVTSVG